MTQVIKFSEAVTIGVHSMVYLASHPGRQVPLNEVAEAFKVSVAHLSKVMQRLGKAGLVKGSRGPTGGYMLVRSAADTRLLEIYEAIEGPFVPRFCLFAEPMCGQVCCGVGDVLGQLNVQMKTYLSETALIALVKAQTKVQKGKKA